jgi:hypothetical protein
MTWYTGVLGALTVLLYGYMGLAMTKTILDLRRWRLSDKRDRAKQRATVSAMQGWAALMAGRCPYCHGSGIELTTDASACLDSDDGIDEPDWDVGDCHLCEGSGVISEPRRQVMLKLLKEMRGKKLRTPFYAALTNSRKPKGMSEV